MDTSPSKRSQRVTPFLVTELLDQAKLMLARGEHVIRLEAGEPDLPAPPQVIEAAKRALDDGLTGYAPSPGTGELREAISTWYADRYGVDVEPDQIIVTSGTSPALLLVQGALPRRPSRVLSPARIRKLCLLRRAHRKSGHTRAHFITQIGWLAGP